MNSVRWIVGSCITATLASASAQASLLYEFQFAGNYNNAGTIGGTATPFRWGGANAGGASLSANNPYGSATDKSLTVSSSGTLTLPGDNQDLYMSAGSSVSFAAWINPTSCNWQGIVNRSEDNGHGWYLRMGPDASLILQAGSGYSQTAASILQTNTWQFVAFTWTASSTPTFYVNGVAYNPTKGYGGTGANLPADASALTTTSVHVGTYDSQYGNFPGNMDTVRLWNDNESANMQSLYQQELSMIPEPATSALAAITGLGILSRRRRSA